MASIAKTQKSLRVASDSAHLELTTIDVVQNLKDYEILVKNHSAGVNHVDNYFLENKWSTPGTGSGVVVAGDVVKVGSKVSRFKLGDTIAAFTFGFDSQDTEAGAYQEYSKILESNSFNFRLEPATGNEIPAGPIKTYESGASIANNFITVGISIFHTFGHIDEKKTLLIYGASTGVGQVALQYAHYIGWRVIAIASAKHHQNLKELGADVVIDYHSDHLAQDIIDLKEDIDFAYVTTGGTKALEEVYEALPTTRAIKLESIQVADISFIKRKKQNIDYGFTRAFTSAGNSIEYGNGTYYHSKPGTLRALKEWVLIVEKLYKEGVWKAKAVTVLSHGLKSVKEGEDLLREGKFGGKRLVVRINDQ
jgi:NADPH:quinone reductase-like Zn-dependent oxidoreductase